MFCKMDFKYSNIKFIINWKNIGKLKRINFIANEIVKYKVYDRVCKIKSIKFKKWKCWKKRQILYRNFLRFYNRNN